MKTLPISVIISTKNEETNIGNCLESIKHQTYSQNKIEIVVVDNNSTDKTKEIARKYTKKVYNYPNSPGDIKNFRGAQVNFGVKKSSGKIIFFPDADMTFDKDLLKEGVELLAGGKLDALYVPEEIIGRGFFGKIRNFERSFCSETCLDALRLVKKKLYLAVGGFDEKNIMFGPDDWDFTKTIRKVTDKISITKSKIYHHEENLTVKTYLRKKKKYAKTFEGYVKKWGKNDSDIKKQFGLWYRYFGVFTENGKWRRLLRHPILAEGMYFLRIVVGINYLLEKVNKK